jgi:hypothetical protein
LAKSQSKELLKAILPVHSLIAKLSFDIFDDLGCHLVNALSEDMQKGQVVYPVLIAINELITEFSIKNPKKSYYENRKVLNIFREKVLC